MWQCWEFKYKYQTFFVDFDISTFALVGVCQSADVCVGGITLFANFPFRTFNPASEYRTTPIFDFGFTFVRLTAMTNEREIIIFNLTFYTNLMLTAQKLKFKIFK